MSQAARMFCLEKTERILGWSQRPLITYDSPPLVEVGISVQFDPPRGLNQAHLGAFWTTQRQEFPHVRAVQPISTTTEVFGNQGQWLPPSLQFALTNEPDCRIQMTSSDGQWMCQVQRNRIVINWRKRTEQYPRFDATWNRFQVLWQAWEELLVDLKLPCPVPRLWELTYVNRTPKGDLWETPSDWPRIFPGLWGGEFATIEGADLRGFQGQWVWETSDPPARLYIEPKPGRSADQPPQDVLLLVLTARGIVVPSDDSKNGGSVIDLIASGINCGHAVIVTTFDRIASNAAKAAWGRHDDVD